MKVGSQRFLLFVLLATLALASWAQQPERALEQPDVKRLREHIGYLASDELGGRKTGTPGATQAAVYIAEQFSGDGLECPAPNSMCHHTSNNHLGYLKRFPYIAAVDLGSGNSLLLMGDGKETALRLREDWMPLGFSSNGSVSQTPAVFVGHGITAAELKHDDYAGLDVKGKVALALPGTPDGDNPHGQFARYSDVRWKAIAAKDKGAKALVVIAGEESFKDDRLARLDYDQTAGEAGLPVVVMSRPAAAKLLGLSDGAQLSQLLKPGKGVEVSIPQRISLAVDITRREAPAENVIGILEGSDPKLKREAIVIGAHYDHLGRGGRSSLAPDSKEIHHGADDNASGVAGVLELARIFAAEKQHRRTIIFIAFGGEEDGLVGSHYYAEHPVTPLTDTVAMINMDMIGRLKENKLIIGGVGTAQEWRQWIDAANARAQKFDLQLNEDGFGPSDHSSFYAKQVPVLFFFTGTHPDYHKPSDTADKINYEGEARVVAFVAELVRALDRSQSRPAYAVAKSSSSATTRGFRVYLGTIPSYAESKDGLVLDGVRDDSPAAKAGLKAGDRITKLAGREIRNVYDYTYALGEMKGGQEYELEAVRGVERLKLKIVPQARQ